MGCLFAQLLPPIERGGFGAQFLAFLYADYEFTGKSSRPSPVRGLGKPFVLDSACARTRLTVSHENTVAPVAMTSTEIWMQLGRLFVDPPSDHHTWG